MSRRALLRRPWPRRLIVAALLIPLMVIGLALMLLGTSAGNLWLLQRAEPYLPGQLTVQNWQGNLLSGVRVGTLDYRLDQLAVTLTDLDLNLNAGDLLSGRLHLRHLSATGVTVTLPPAAPNQADSPPLQLPDSVALPLGVRIDRLEVAHFVLAGDSPLRIDAIQGRDLAAWRHFKITRLALTVAGTRLNAGDVDGGLSTPYPLNGTLLWQRPGAADAVPEMQGVLGLKGTLADLHIDHALSAPVRVISTGHIGYRDGTLHLDLSHHWPTQPLPAGTPVPVTLDEGDLTTRGTPDKLTVQGQTTLTAQDKPIHIKLAGQASTHALQLRTLTLTSDEQSLTLNGRLGYADGLDWRLKARGKNLNPAVLAPAWPGRLALDAASHGHWDGASDWRATITPFRITGRLKNTPITLTGDARHDNGNRFALDLKGHWGKDTISASGTIGDTLKLDGRLAVARLNRWYSQLRGHADAQWRLRGPLSTPTLSARLKGGDLAWRQWRLNTLQARVENLSTGEQTMSLDLKARGLHQGGQTRADRVTLAARGTRARHSLTITAQRRQANSQVVIEAGLDAANRWGGQVKRWTLKQPDIGTWQLRKAVPFELAADRQSLGRLCLTATHGEGRLCASGKHRANDTLQARLSVRALPLALANPWLGGGLSLAGKARADAQLSGSLSHPEGNWSLKLDGAKVTLTRTDAQQTLALTQAQLHGTLKNQRLHDTLDLVVADQGELHAEVENGLALNTPLSGQVRVSIPRLDDLAPLIPRVSEVKGKVAGHLRLQGTLAKPGATGKLTLSGGEATVPELGTSVEAIELTVAGNPDGLNIHGRARFGKQPLTLEGRWDPARSPLAVNLTLQGKRLLVANRSDATVYLSPNLSLKGDQDGLRLSGEVSVPEADLKPRQLPENAVTVSQDQVLVDARARQHSPIPFSMAVHITLGDKVHFQGFGLDATLGGDLKVTQKPGEPAQLYGDLVIQEGRYKAYGQNLAIDNGRLLFQGPPDNPGLDIRAIRKIPSESQVVGVQLSGTLQQPQAHIFSNPELEESQAMSYLLTGHGLNQGSQGDTAEVAQALALYGLQKGQGVTRKIGNTLGLDEITVGSDWGGAEDAALMLGKQLSDRLYLTYAVGLFDAVSTVMLRYTLTRTLHLEAQSSTKSQAIDLIWEKELN